MFKSALPSQERVRFRHIARNVEVQKTIASVGVRSGAFEVSVLGWNRGIGDLVR
jgi:hypothetical protein